MQAFTKEQLDEIIMKRFVLGLSAEKISEDYGCGKNVIYNITKVFEAVKNDDMETQKKIAYNFAPRYMYDYAYNKLGKEMPKSLCDLFEQIKANRKVKREPQPETPEQKNEAVYYIRLLEEVQRQNELLQQIIDVVIPNYTEQLRTATMKSTSIMCQKFHPILEDVNTIRKELS